MTPEIEHLVWVIQTHAEGQPGGSVKPVTIRYDDSFPKGPHWPEVAPWGVEFVLGLNAARTKRRWGYARGFTLEEALRDAREQQLADGGER